MRTTSDGSDAWTDDDLDGLRLEIRGAITGGSMYINFMRAKVVYQEIIETYPSDDQVILSGGTLELRNGKVVIG